MNKEKEKEKKKIKKQKINKVESVEIVKRSRYKSGLFIQSVVFSVINFIVLIIVVIIIAKLPALAEEIKEVHTNQILEQEKTDALVLQADIDKNKEKIGELRRSQISADNLVSFFEYRDQITSDPRVSRFELGDKIVRDKNKNVGYPITIEFSGSAQDLKEIYQNVQSIPFLMMPMVMNIVIEEEDTGKYLFTYSGILYF